MTGRRFEPLTPERTDDLARLFERDGVTRNCWCMWWRLKTTEFERLGRPAREAAFRARIADGPPPGLLAYDGEEPVGWVQVTPRTELPRFNRSRIAGPVDADIAGVWALSCFFVRKDHRRSGLMTELARAACAHAARNGAGVVEAAALDPKRPMMWGEGHVGLVRALSRAGFAEIERRSETRIVMRWTPEAARAQ